MLRPYGSPSHSKRGAETADWESDLDCECDCNLDSDCDRDPD